jgi:hypothetical protein
MSQSTQEESTAPVTGAAGWTGSRLFSVFSRDDPKPKLETEALWERNRNDYA